MSLVSRAWSAAVVVVILAPMSMADDPPEVATKSELGPTIPRCVVRPGQVPPGAENAPAHEPGKIPVVLVHGLWGFPHQWDRMVECLESDPELRGRYQFWLFSYASGDSIPFSAHQLRLSLRRARLLFDPKGTDEAFDRLVVVGHSLGGILAKMMGQSSGLRLWQTVSDCLSTRSPALKKIACSSGRCTATNAFRKFVGSSSLRPLIVEARLPAASSATWGRGSATVLARSVRLARRSWLEMTPTHLFPLSTGKTRRASASWPKDIRSWRPFATWGSIHRSAPIRSSPTFATRPMPARLTGLFPIRAPTSNVPDRSCYFTAATFA